MVQVSIINLKHVSSGIEVDISNVHTHQVNPAPCPCLMHMKAQSRAASASASASASGMPLPYLAGTDKCSPDREGVLRGAGACCKVLGRAERCLQDGDATALVGRHLKQHPAMAPLALLLKASQGRAGQGRVGQGRAGQGRAG